MGQSGTIICVVGPTASGKSDVGVALAHLLGRVKDTGAEPGGEVVNADAMQLYRGMDVGTAKITDVEMRGVPHHLLDVLDVTQAADVATYQQRARTVFVDVQTRGRVPLLVGGSGLYVRAALDDMRFPGTDAEVRGRYEDQLARHGAEALHALLARRDPAAAAKILPGNGRRIVRALEVGELTGVAFAASLPQPRYVRPAMQVGLAVPRDQLDLRIEARVERMWAAGLVSEVRTLEAAGLREGLTASRALGYAQVLDALDGKTSEDEARELTARLTRRFARKQESWFRRDQRIVWLDAGDDRDSEDIAQEIQRHVQRRTEEDDHRGEHQPRGSDENDLRSPA
ncbi:MAG: tRNA (adenosine(37)-N6)-dimethylallyltransferase MiaA [Janthinobacterium lividum]